jgi:serine/threonine protein kinase
MQRAALPESNAAMTDSLTKVIVTSSPPTEIASYKIDINDISECKKLKSGLNGKVYRGLWKDKKRVALKLPGKSPLSAEDVISEFKIREKLPRNCPNVVPFLGGSTAPECPYVVTTYLANGSLKSLLNKNKSLDWVTSINIMKDIAIGLTAIHANKIIHRDLKSNNIFIDDQLRAYLGDFGLARECNQGYEYQSSAHSRACGTSGYIAPESYQQQIYSAKSDTYSLGVVLWEIASHAEIPLGQTQKQLSYKEAEAITVGDEERDVIPKDIPAGLTKLIRWCWEKKPINRPTETEILASLDDCLTGLKPQK